MTNRRKAAVLVGALLIGSVLACPAARSQSSASVVEFESPLASPQPLQGYLRQPNSAGPSPAVVLLHSCNGNWARLDERWGKRIASWGYVTLTVDSFGPRGIKNTCNSGAPVDLAFDAYRALNFLVRQPFVDPDRVAVLGFSQGAWLALASVERGAIEKTSRNKFRAAVAFYPRCLGSKGNMTVPTLILIGERDDWAPAQECRNMVDGRDDWGISRSSGQGIAGPARRLSRRLSCLRRAGPADADRVPRAPSRIQQIRGGSGDRCVARISSGQYRRESEGAVTVKAVVFDAYGTLFDIQSVAAITEQSFPGYGEIVTQIWRIKQLEYSWLRSLMRRYEDFSVVTRNLLAYTLRCLGLNSDADVFERIIGKYLQLDLYPDAAATLAALRDRKLAILSNGAPAMLEALVRNSGLALDATISVDSQKIFKPSPDAYALIESTLGIVPADVLFVSSNPWDACGAKAFGLKVAWIERVTPEAMALAFAANGLVPPLTMFKAIRMQMDELGLEPDYRIRALGELPKLVAA